MILAGLPKDQVIDRLKQTVARKEVPSLESGAMCYMMSRDGNLGDSQGHWHPHLMFLWTTIGSCRLGIGPSRLSSLSEPVVSELPGAARPFMVVVDRWSDGTSAPMHGQ
jgi:hypothetical protein